MTNHQDTSTERERFEVWITPKLKAGSHLNKSASGIYLDNRVAAKWSAWQAALASRDEASQQPQGQAVSDEQIDAALRDIDHVARYYEVNEYGLPVHLLDGADFPDYKDVAEGMRQPIRAILALRDGPESGITAKEQGNEN